MNHTRTIVFVNDHADYNTRYRAGLMEQLRQRGYTVVSRGLFDGPRSALATSVETAFGANRILVSSNLRANLVCLLMIWRRGLVIVNGLGRYRRHRRFRVVLMALVRSSPTKRVALQNYADFRYFRRYLGSATERLSWIPGSGGTARPTGPEGIAFAVQRDTKLGAVADDLRAAAALIDRKPLIVVGCHPTKAAISILGQGARPIGPVPQNAILSHGQIFVQPDGYGEGIPHSMVDAVASGLEIRLPRAAALRFGLTRCGGRIEPWSGRWCIVRPTEDLCRSLGAAQIEHAYIREIEAL